MPGSPPLAPWWRDRAILSIVGLALLLRLAAAVLFAHEPSGVSDPAFYWNAAGGIADGEDYQSPYGHPTAYFPPGYPYFLGEVVRGARAVGFDSATVAAAGIAQALLGAVTVLLVILTGRLIGGRSTGLTAGALVALWPNLVLYAAAFLSESLYLPLFMLFAYALVRWAAGGGVVWSWLLVAAAALGASTLVRPQVLVAVPAVAVAALLAGFGWRRTGTLVAALVLGAVVFLLPWTVRNQSVFGQFVPVSTNGGANLCIGYSDAAWGGFHLSPECAGAGSYVQGPAAELAGDRSLTRAARTWIAAHPDRVIPLAVAKMQLTYAQENDALQGIDSYGESPGVPAVVRPPLEFVGNVFYALVAVLAVIGLGVQAVRCLRDRTGTATGWFLVALTVSAALVPAFFFGDSRFKVPVAPLMAILAAVTVTTVLGRRSGSVSGTSRTRPRGVAA